MENQFIRHEPCFERILFVLTLDRKKMKERILIGEEQQIRFQLNGSQNAEVTNYKKSRENRKIFIWSKKGAENQALFRGLQKKLIMGQRTRSGL